MARPLGTSRRPGPGAPAYRLLARGTLEDASGNRVNGRFETGADERPGRPADVEIPFDVAAGAAR
jgi:hypothetical protein